MSLRISWVLGGGRQSHSRGCLAVVMVNKHWFLATWFFLFWQHGAHDGNTCKTSRVSFGSDRAGNGIE